MVQFTILASGSGGNASLLQVGGFGLLIDVGLGPRQLAQRLATIRSSWRQVSAVLLTHTHSDHWREPTLALLHRYRIPLYCHAEHIGTLRTYSPTFPQLQSEGLVHLFPCDGEWSLMSRLQVRPLRVRHDSGATFGFRFQGPGDLFGQAVCLGYVTDLGCWQEELAGALADVDVLALEFNHDVRLEALSGRHPRLVARVLGDEGHLSNDQAADLLREVLRRSGSTRLQHVVQLHLSRDCNRPHLARQAAQTVLAECNATAQIHTASQDEVGPSLELGTVTVNGRTGGGRKARGARKADSVQEWLPGLGPECSR